MCEKPTTPDLVEVVTGLFEAADRGDWDAVISAYAPDVIWESDDGILDTAGASGVRGFLEEWAGMFEDFTIKVETVVDLGNGVAYAVYRQEGRPAGSTGVVADGGVLIYEWVDGMIARVIGRPDIDEARAIAKQLAESRGAGERRDDEATHGSLERGGPQRPTG
jgi:ketosteroid isomerase-like protein